MRGGIKKMEGNKSARENNEWHSAWYFLFLIILIVRFFTYLCFISFLLLFFFKVPFITRCVAFFSLHLSTTIQNIQNLSPSRKKELFQTIFFPSRTPRKENGSSLSAIVMRPRRYFGSDCVPLVRKMEFMEEEAKKAMYRAHTFEISAIMGRTLWRSWSEMRQWSWCWGKPKTNYNLNFPHWLYRDTIVDCPGMKWEKENL